MDYRVQPKIRLHKLLPLVFTDLSLAKCYIYSTVYILTTIGNITLPTTVQTENTIKASPGNDSIHMPLATRAPCTKVDLEGPFRCAQVKIENLNKPYLKFFLELR